MGSIHTSGDDIICGLTDFSLTRSGLFIPNDEAVKIYEASEGDFKPGYTRMRSEAYEIVSEKMLDYLGHYSLDRINPTHLLYAASKNTKQLSKNLSALQNRLDEIYGRKYKLNNFEENYINMVRKYFFYNIHVNMYERKEAERGVSLADLWNSEKLPDASDKYIDQEYIDFLDANPSALSEMNWRKFEGLTAEYFHREGYQIQLGKGRGDGGVDIVASKQIRSSGVPERILIQCKRYKDGNTVAINEVKALYFDIHDKGYDKGLMITTSRIAKGGMDIIKSGRYPMSAAENEEVRRMVSSMTSFDKKRYFGNAKSFREKIKNLDLKTVISHSMLPSQLLGFITRDTQNYQDISAE